MKKRALTYRLMTTIIMVLGGVMASAQELQVKININTQQVERTDKAIFENLKQSYSSKSTNESSAVST